MPDILPDDPNIRLQRLRDCELDLLIALDDCARSISSELDTAATLRKHLRRVRREIRATEIADLRARFHATADSSLSADA